MVSLIIEVALLKTALQVNPTSPLVIAGPPQLQTYIRDLGALQELGLHVEAAPILFIDNNGLLSARHDAQRLSKNMKCSIFSKIETVLVQHRARCFGLVLTGEDGWKIVYVIYSFQLILIKVIIHRYSGDTQPCQALVEAGKGATLLIHEATIEDELPELARSKGEFAHCSWYVRMSESPCQATALSRKLSTSLKGDCIRLLQCDAVLKVLSPQDEGSALFAYPLFSALSQVATLRRARRPASWL